MYSLDCFVKMCVLIPSSLFAGGSPLGYFDWSMVQQGILSGIESVALFGVAGVAMEYCFRKGYISKFPG